MNDYYLEDSSDWAAQLFAMWLSTAWWMCVLSFAVPVIYVIVSFVRPLL